MILYVTKKIFMHKWYTSVCYIGLFMDEFCMTGQLLRFNVFPIKSIQKC